MEATLKVRRHHPEVPLPAKAHPTDAGVDLTAMAVEALRPNVFAFDAGVSVEPPPGYYCEVVPRSSIVKTDFILANSVGVIDPDYRGKIKIVLRYLGRENGEAAAQALLGTRIAQLLVRRVERVRVVEAETLAETPRGEGGFGSSGQ